MTEEVRRLSHDELLGEVRRRGLPDDYLKRKLKLTDPNRYPPGEPADRLRRLALYALAGLGSVLVLSIIVMAIRGVEIPDLLSGLAGSAIGAIAGILASGSASHTTALPAVGADPPAGERD